MRKKLIQIVWSAPLLIDDAIRSPLSQAPGLYYLTRKFGSHESSRYLGKATHTIRERLQAHRREWLPNLRGNIYVRMGQIVYPRQADAAIIDHAESALIFEHGKLFPDNTDKQNSYFYSDLYMIENTGNRFELRPVVDMYEHPEG